MQNYHELGELAPRDVVARSIFLEMQKTGDTNVFLDITHKDRAYLEKRFPTIFNTCLKYGIDMRKQPILIYPTLHYQNGGIKIGANGMSDVENLFVAGEAVGGIHGENRLMGNSLLDIIVFGRNAGINAAAKAKETTVGKLTLSHVDAFAEEMKAAGIVTDKVSPLLLPRYTHGNPRYEAK